jgi:hypothetical protein
LRKRDLRLDAVLSSILFLFYNYIKFERRDGVF